MFIFLLITLYILKRASRPPMPKPNWSSTKVYSKTQNSKSPQTLGVIIQMAVGRSLASGCYSYKINNFTGRTMSPLFNKQKHQCWWCEPLFALLKILYPLLVKRYLNTNQFHHNQDKAFCKDKCTDFIKLNATMRFCRNVKSKNHFSFKSKRERLLFLLEI